MSSVAPADLPVGKDLGTLEAAEQTTYAQPKTMRVKKQLTSRTATIASLIIAVLWTIPTFGLFISSFRPAELIRTTGMVDDLRESGIHARELPATCCSRRRGRRRSSARTS